jgi:hypothetical protein
MAAPYDGQSNVKGTPGILGDNTKGGDGVWGQANAGAGTDPGRGVVGVSDGGTGVWGDTNTGRAVVGVVRNAGDAVWGETKTGRGMVGVCEGDGTGVWADTATGRGMVGLAHVSGDGVWGESKSGRGVVGVSDSDGAGVWGVSQQGEGVHGETNAGTFVAAVTGLALNANGAAPGVIGRSLGLGTGVFGQSNGDAGVTGFHGDPRLQETTVANDGAIAGVFGASDVGSGVVAYARNPAVPALHAFGGLRSYAGGYQFAGEFDGNVQVNGDIFLPGADCAEHFDVAGDMAIDAGTVVVIHEDGTLRQSEDAYDRKVAGVISGAGEYKPGIILDKRESNDKRQPVALVGKVYCKVDAQYSPIGVGDLLTSSPTPGHAMKVTDPLKAFGAVLGKALGNLTSGTGLVPVLVCLQ